MKIKSRDTLRDIRYSDSRPKSGLGLGRANSSLSCTLTDPLENVTFEFSHASFLAIMISSRHAFRLDTNNCYLICTTFHYPLDGIAMSSCRNARIGRRKISAGVLPFDLADAIEKRRYTNIHSKVAGHTNGAPMQSLAAFIPISTNKLVE